QRFPQRRKVNFVGIVLPVEDALLLQIEGDKRKAADPRLARDVPEDRDKSRRINGLKGRRLCVLRSKIDQDLYVQRRIFARTCHWRLFPELLAVKRPNVARVKGKC